MGCRANKEPLASAEMPGFGNQRYLLGRVADLDAKPCMMGITHLGADYAARNLSPAGVSPRNAAYANIRSKPDEAPSRKVIQIEL